METITSEEKQNKVASLVISPIVSIKYFHLEGLSKDFLVKFEAAEDMYYQQYFC